MDEQEERRLLYNAAIEAFGVNAQKLMAIEEMAELSEKLAKDIRGRDVRLSDIVAEIIDVETMMTQLCMIYNVDPRLIETIRSHKTRKLAEIIILKNAEEQTE